MSGGKNGGGGGVKTTNLKYLITYLYAHEWGNGVRLMFLQIFVSSFDVILLKKLDNL